MLRWARLNGCPWDINSCRFAAEQGHLDVLKWCKENEGRWDARTCINAAGSGHLDLLRWAHENGCPWDEVRPLHGFMRRFQMEALMH